MEQLMTTLCNSIITILTAISQFDITKVNPDALAVIAQTVADTVRVLIDIGTVIIIIFGG